jgi:hypothetical protein
MDRSVLSPPETGGGVGMLTPEEAHALHEFFRVGAQREVLLLGDPEEQRVHHVERRKRKLCTARVGPCALCEAAPFDPDVEPSQLEFVVPAAVRPVREPEFVQRVAVFPRAAGLKLREVCGDAYRGRLLHVVRGASNRLTIRPLGGLPRGFPASLPPAFPVLPFVRARFGLRPDPRVPVVRFGPIRCEAQQPGGAGWPKPLALGWEDSGLTEEDLAKLRAYIGRLDAEQPGQPEQPAPPPPPAPAPAGPPGDVRVVEPAAEADPPGVVAAKVLAATSVPLGPPERVPGTGAPPAGSERTPPGRELADGQRASSMTPPPAKALDALRRRGKLARQEAATQEAAADGAADRAATIEGDLAELEAAFRPTVPFAAYGKHPGPKGGAS